MTIRIPRRFHATAVMFFMLVTACSLHAKTAIEHLENVVLPHKADKM